ncbi:MULTISPECIES: hypothetical protein [Acetobacteraceae]|uniref:Transposase n=1 Tax=Acetobacter sicerae TaxID=85325 RepID=A0ABS8VYE9_9PROT|nr:MULTISPECIES: hypothetical protein [Acetobacteraceae]MCE0745334.1 hypothetical protein [Acetobacter sicerae]GFE97727.1 hypothetical protein DmGdi_28000 [Gluconobacter sp. Gdi]
MRAKDATVSTSPRVILDPTGHGDGNGEGLRALIRALARQAARDYIEHENGPIRTRSED